jgi:glycerate dehydrogenase
VQLADRKPGKRVAGIGKLMSMDVIIAEHKHAENVRQGFTSFQEAIRRATILVLAAPLNGETRHMISTPEFEMMDNTAILVNVSRGGVVDEVALATALKQGNIAGAATDVFSHEPATERNSVLLDRNIPNFILSPHIAWYSSTTLLGTINTLKKNIEGFVYGRTENVVVKGRA